MLETCNLSSYTIPEPDPTLQLSYLLSLITNFNSSFYSLNTPSILLFPFLFLYYPCILLFLCFHFQQILGLPEKLKISPGPNLVVGITSLFYLLSVPWWHHPLASANAGSRIYIPSLHYSFTYHTTDSPFFPCRLSVTSCAILNPFAAQGLYILNLAEQEPYTWLQFTTSFSFGLLIDSCRTCKSLLWPSCLLRSVLQAPTDWLLVC